MSYWVIKLDDTKNVLSDYRPQIECPQWNYDRSRFYRFATKAEAVAFWDVQRKTYELGRVRYVHVFTPAETALRRKALKRVLFYARHCEVRSHTDWEVRHLVKAVEDFDAVTQHKSDAGPPAGESK